MKLKEKNTRLTTKADDCDVLTAQLQYAKAEEKRVQELLTMVIADRDAATAALTAAQKTIEDMQSDAQARSAEMMACKMTLLSTLRELEQAKECNRTLRAKALKYAKKVTALEVAVAEARVSSSAASRANSSITSTLTPLADRKSTSSSSSSSSAAFRRSLWLDPPKQSAAAAATAAASSAFASSSRAKQQNYHESFFNSPDDAYSSDEE